MTSITAADGKHSPRILMATTAVAVILAGCATYSDSFSVVHRDLANRQYDNALKTIEKQSGDKRERVLYFLNKGMVLRMKGEYAESNTAFEAAKAEMDRLYAASVSEHTLSFLVNDATVSYGGEDYEQVLVHLYMALNYLQLGQPDDARVEALQVDEKLREIEQQVSGSKYTEDAFSRYLAGMIYEDDGEWSDAMISYRDAYQAYKKYRTDFGLPVPDTLKHDLLRLARREGLKNEAAQYRKEFGIVPSPAANNSDSAKQGELVFILNNGLAPVKRERSFTTIDPATGILVRIATPYYETRPNNVVDARVSVAGKTATTELVENIDAIARQSLESHMPAIIARSIARAVAKTALVRAASGGSNNNNQNAARLLDEFAMQVTALATERADTRSWLTLPANIQMARLPLPAGSYTIKVELLGADGQLVSTREFPGVVISEAHMTYLTQHWIPPMLSITRSEP
jgi:hypothetical protein